MSERRETLIWLGWTSAITSENGVFWGNLGEKWGKIEMGNREIILDMEGKFDVKLGWLYVNLWCGNGSATAYITQNQLTSDVKYPPSIPL